MPSVVSVPFLPLFRIVLTSGVRMKAKKTSIRTRVIGLVKKIERLPPEIMNAFLMLDSRSFASTKDRSIGEVSKSFFFRMYASAPDRNMITTP